MAPMMSRPVVRAPGERALAWLYTGPLGHLYSTLTDIAVLWVRWIVSRRRTSGRR